MRCLGGHRIRILVEVVDRADQTVVGDERIWFIVPEAAKAWCRSGLSRPLQTRQRIRRDVANPTRCQHGDDVSGSRVPFSQAQRHPQRLVEEVLAGHGDEELEDAIAPQHRFRTEPAARHLENDFTATDEDDAAVGDDHACR